MTKQLSNTDRKKLLCETIENKFGKIGSRSLARIASTYQDSLMQVFQVTDIKKSRIELTHLLRDEVYRPVVLDDEVRLLLARNDTFQMVLGLKDHCWNVLYMSPPYC